LLRKEGKEFLPQLVFLTRFPGNFKISVVKLDPAATCLIETGTPGAFPAAIWTLVVFPVLSRDGNGKKAKAPPTRQSWFMPGTWRDIASGWFVQNEKISFRS
jgi:hypothetical protein